ncbi:HAD family acid phosphatase, partial [Klebsiella pneumoniae subsp. pneumoniae]
RWVAANGPSLTPGALEFLEYARSRGVEIFYVSSRDQGEKTLEYALGNMRALRMPFADAEHVTILRDSSNKEPAQKAIAAQYDVLLMLGDNLNDFQRRYYVDDVMHRWVAANGPSLTPGALEFLEYARSRGVEIFYVS